MAEHLADGAAGEATHGISAAKHNTKHFLVIRNDRIIFELAAEIMVNPREGAGSSVADRVEFHKETDGAAPALVGEGVLAAGSDPARYELSYSADSHGAEEEVRTYFASCVARSVQDGTKKVGSYSRPVRVRRTS